MVKRTTRNVLAGILLVVLIVLLRRLLPGGAVMGLTVGAVLTVVIYGVAFKNYYMKILRRR